MKRSRTDRTNGGGVIVLPHEACEHLRAAAKQMDLLLESEQTEKCLGHLVALLQHLRAFRQLASWKRS